MLSLLLWISILTSCFKLYYWFYFFHPSNNKIKKQFKATNRHLQRVRECMLGNFIAGINSLYSQLQGGYENIWSAWQISYRVSADSSPDTKYFQALQIFPYPTVTDCITNNIITDKLCVWMNKLIHILSSS